MTQSPKEKAEELCLKFLPYCKASWNAFTGLEKTTMEENAKQCAIVAVNEMIHYLEIVLGVDKQDFRFWQQVKAELEKK